MWALFHNMIYGTPEQFVLGCVTILLGAACTAVCVAIVRMLFE